MRRKGVAAAPGMATTAVRYSSSLRRRSSMKSTPSRDIRKAPMVLPRICFGGSASFLSLTSAPNAAVTCRCSVSNSLKRRLTAQLEPSDSCDTTWYVMCSLPSLNVFDSVVGMRISTGTMGGAGADAAAISRCCGGYELMISSKPSFLF